MYSMARMKRANIPSPETTLTIAMRYAAGERSSALAAEYGCTPNSVINWCKRHGVASRPVGSSSRRYTLNETYFDQIDTEEKAYWLGLLAADGYVADNGHVGLGLSGEEDKCVLEAFVKALGSNAPIRPHKLTYPNAKPAYRVGVSSSRLRDALVRLGVTPRKSLTLQFPTPDQVPSHLLRHFVRGYFDGDGSVSHKRDGGFSLSVTSSPDFIRGLALAVQSAIGITPHIEKPTRVRCHHLKMGGPFVTYLVLDWLYREAVVYLPRKQAKYTLCSRIVSDKLSRPHDFHNVYTHADTMGNADRCATLLGISFDMTAYNGLSSSREEQDHILSRYNEGSSVRQLGRELGCSNNLIRNTLVRNGVAIRTPREAAVVRWVSEKR